MLRKKNKSLTDVEISIIKRLHSDGKNNQEILGIINSKKDTPSLHINPGRISEVIKDKRGANVTAADDDTLKSSDDITIKLLQKEITFGRATYINASERGFNLKIEALQGLEEIGLEGKMGQTGNSRATNSNEAVTETHKKVAESQIEDLKPFIKNYLEQRRSK